ncbi:uncharacterized protein LOC122091868 isoform X3 [Macadamia integrifolia]|uniref:uncharacterized protein LOC122091868 isoform X3 n=1 Tax=Macadamia integrifolia TaxID=60698 RepID=UPI001C4F85E2|nr:uncharacterized protein LOC122091868 isoform X3 [Macadamia integrifolia]
MLGKRLASTLLKISPATQSARLSMSTEEGKTKNLGRKVVSVLLLSLTGGVALSALDDLAIYHGCSRVTRYQISLHGIKAVMDLAMEKASQSQAIKDALGEPIVKGPWYNASLAVAHKRHSVSCTFPVSGPQGTGVFQLRAVRHGDGHKCLMGRRRCITE